MIDQDRRRERRIAVVQTALILLGILTVILTAQIQRGLGWRTVWFLMAATACSVLLRAWAVERFSPKSADVYVRILVLEFLPEVLVLWGRDREVRVAWRSHDQVLRTLYSAPPERLRLALRHLNEAGYPSDPSFPLSGLLSMLGYAVAGLALGIWLPTVLGSEFLVLCKANGAWWNLVVPVHLPAAVWIALVALIVFKISLWLFNRAQRNQVRRWSQTNLKGELIRIASPRLASRRDGFVRDTTSLANLLDTTVGEVETLRAMWGLARRRGWLWNLKPSEVSERSLNQMLFVVGLWFSLALPPLFGIGCH